MRHWWGILVVVAGCVGDSTADHDSGVDASLPDAADSAVVESGNDAGVDAPVEAGACDLTKAFGAPVPIAEINQPNTSEEGFAVAAGGLLTYFGSDRPQDGGVEAGGTGKYDIYEAKRASSTQPWGSLRRLPLNGGSPDRSPVLSDDGLDLYYTISPNFDVVYATRTSLALDFPAGTIVAGLSSPQSDQVSWVSIDKKRLYLASDRSGMSKVYFADISSTPVVNLLGTPINDSSGEDTAAVLTSDERHIVFASSRPGGGGGSFDLWEASRPTPTDTFGTATPVAGNTSRPEYPAQISGDGCVLYITRYDSTNYNLYVLTKPQ